MTDWLSVPARNALPFVTRTLSKRFEDSKYTASLPPSTPVQLSAYEALRQRGLHTRRLASPLRFARLCSYLRRLPPLGSAGGTLLVWRLTAEEVEIASTGRPAELFAARELSPGMRRKQQAALAQILMALADELQMVPDAHPSLRMLPDVLGQQYLPP